MSSWGMKALELSPEAQYRDSSSLRYTSPTSPQTTRTRSELKPNKHTPHQTAPGNANPQQTLPCKKTMNRDWTRLENRNSTPDTAVGREEGNPMAGTEASDAYPATGTVTAAGDGQDLDHLHNRQDETENASHLNSGGGMANWPPPLHRPSLKHFSPQGWIGFSVGYHLWWLSLKMWWMFHMVPLT
jgi:hypothetical protein